MNTSAHPAAPSNASVASDTTRRVFKLGLDIDLNFVVTAVECDHGAIKPAHKWTRP